MPVQCIEVNIFGQLLKVNCPNGLKNDLYNAVNSLNQKLQNLKIKTGVSNTEHLVLVTALNISYELEHEKLKIKEIILRSKKIISYLNKLKIIKF
ncbi:MAG: cell division protein ZapA [Buchnera aphidicola (Meitanaphis flavogallis)]